MFPGFRGGGRGGFPPPFPGGRFPMMNPNMNMMGFQGFGPFNNGQVRPNFLSNNMQNNFIPNMNRGGMGRGGIGTGRGGGTGRMGSGTVGGPSLGISGAPVTPTASVVEKKPDITTKSTPETTVKTEVYK